MCLIDHGWPERVHELEAGRVRRFRKGSGLPVKVPVVEMIEIGAGGGSIARVDLKFAGQPSSTPMRSVRA